VVCDFNACPCPVRELIVSFLSSKESQTWQKYFVRTWPGLYCQSRVYHSACWEEFTPNGLKSAALLGFTTVFRDILVEIEDALTHTEMSNLLLTAARGRCVEIGKMLLEMNVDIHSQDSEGYTALHIAAEQEDKDFITLLIDAGANINAQAQDKVPLRLALEAAMLNPASDTEAIDVIVSSLADEVMVPNGLANCHGQSPLHWALQLPPLKRVPYIKALIKAHARIDEKNEFGETTLHLAAQGNSFNAANSLVEAGADISIQSAYGRTALQIAASSHHTAIAKTLLRVTPGSGSPDVEFGSIPLNSRIIEFAALGSQRVPTSDGESQQTEWVMRITDDSPIAIRHNKLEEILSMSEYRKRLETSIPIYEELVSLYPNDPVFLDSLGHYYWRVGDEMNASLCFDKALSIDPANQGVARLDDLLHTVHCSHLVGIVRCAKTTSITIPGSAVLDTNVEAAKLSGMALTRISASHAFRWIDPSNMWVTRVLGTIFW
jgi:ankyrin repeat protein